MQELIFTYSFCMLAWVGTDTICVRCGIRNDATRYDAFVGVIIGVGWSGMFEALLCLGDG